MIVFDAIGARVVEQSVTGVAQEIDLAGRSVGIYFVRVQIPNGSFTQRLIKE